MRVQLLVSSSPPVEIVAILCHDKAVALFDILEGGLRNPVMTKRPGLLRVTGSRYTPYFTRLALTATATMDSIPEGEPRPLGIEQRTALLEEWCFLTEELEGQR